MVFDTSENSQGCWSPQSILTGYHCPLDCAQNLSQMCVLGAQPIDLALDPVCAAVLNDLCVTQLSYYYHFRNRYTLSHVWRHVWPHVCKYRPLYWFPP